PLADAEALAQFIFVSRRSRCRRIFAAHPMYLIGTQPEFAQHRAIRHREVALRMVGRDASLVAPEKLHFLPIDTEVKARREQVVCGGGRRSTREAGGETG